MKIRAIELSKAQAGWKADVTFAVTTARQFTDEEFTSRSGGRYLLTALWSGIRDARRMANLLEARPGERAGKGWAE